MNTEKFIEGIKAVVTESSVKGVTSLLISPPGRKPKSELLKMSEFYNKCTEQEREVIENIIKLSVDNGVFGFLCVLDGVRAIEDNDSKGRFILTYQSDDEYVLNQEEDLHEYYNAL